MCYVRKFVLCSGDMGFRQVSDSPWAIVRRCLRDRRFRFYHLRRTPTCERQTDGQTDTR